MQPEPHARELTVWRWLFVLVGIYDSVLGFAFLAFHGPLFDALGIARPEESAYVHVAAALIAVQGLGYFLIARRPLRNVDLVVLGGLYKLAYTGLALYYSTIDEAPHGIFLFFGAVDAVVLVAFLVFLRRFRRELGG